MAKLGENRWGKSEVRVSKVHRGPEADTFSDLIMQILLTGDVERAHTVGDNAGVVPTDTMRNTVYGLAQDHLGHDLEAFGAVVAKHFLNKPGIESARVEVKENRWTRHTNTGFTGGGSERRVAIVTTNAVSVATEAGIEGLVVLKTRGSAFSGFPGDEYTILPEAEDRLLATSVTATWKYTAVPDDTTATWERIRAVLLDRFFTDWSASVQHQGFLMGEAVLASIPQIDEISFHLPNQHHLPFDLSRFGKENNANVFHPVSEPYGDIQFTMTR